MSECHLWFMISHKVFLTSIEGLGAWALEGIQLFLKYEYRHCCLDAPLWTNICLQWCKMSKMKVEKSASKPHSQKCIKSSLGWIWFVIHNGVKHFVVKCLSLTVIVVMVWFRIKIRISFFLSRKRGNFFITTAKGQGIKTMMIVRE